MSEIKPIVTDLFRFMSLRSTQLVDPLKKEIGYVYHPDTSQSAFLSEAKGVNLVKTRRIVQQAAKKFGAKRSYKDIQQLNPDIYFFGMWLQKNKKRLPVKMLVEKAKNIDPLTPKQNLEIWDNLFYQLIQRNKATLRQACSTMIIANNFVSKAGREKLQTLAEMVYDDDRSNMSNDKKHERLIKRIACAKLVIPKAFSANKKAGTVLDDLTDPSGEKDPGGKLPETKKPVKKKIKKPINKEELNRRNIMANSEKRRKRLKTVKDDMKKHSMRRSQLREKNIDEVLGDEQMKFLPETRSYLSKDRLKGRKYREIYTETNAEILHENKKQRDAQAVSRKKTESERKKEIGDYCYLIKLDTTNKYDQLTMTIKMPRLTVDVARAKFRLTVDKEVWAQSTDIEVLKGKTVFKTYNLFPKTQLTINLENTYSLKGEIILTDRKTIPINIILNSDSPQFYSCVEETEENGETTDVDTTDGETTNGDDVNIGDSSYGDNKQLYGVNRIGMGIFRRVEQEVCCYVPGEVSHIENIMAREYKERSTRSFTSTEDSTEFTTEYEVETQSDTATTTRNEMQTEVSEVLEKSNNMGLGASTGVSGSYYGMEFGADAYFDYSTGSSASNSDSEAKIYAEEVTKAAAERILQKTSEKRTSKIIKEFEEKNRHGFDNREGDEHVTGIYRWVDIIYTNRLVNYGNMEMVEFLIPEPARFYKQSKMPPEEEPEQGTDQGGEEIGIPHPNDLGILGPSDIEAYLEEGQSTDSVPNYYENLQRKFGIIVDGPPSEYKNSGTLHANHGKLKEKQKYDHYSNESLPIEEGYQIFETELTGQFNHDAKDGKGTNWIVSVGGEQWTKNIQEGEANNKRIYHLDETLEYEDAQSSSARLYVHVERTRSYTVSAKVTTVITPQRLLEWQTAVYQEFEAAHLADLAAQQRDEEQEVKLEEEAKEKLSTGNSTLNRQIEIRELKRTAIEMVTKPFGIAQGADFIGKGKCDVPFVKKRAIINKKTGEKLDWNVYSSHIKFFEQAFEWDLMAYLFYPYYWAQRCDWIELLQAEDPKDLVFESFLQSGMARMVVPVRRGFERAVNYYFETGDIWNGGDLVLDTDDDLYLSIDQELEEPKSFVEEEWETRVPTTLTIIQGDSAFLRGEGLPCCDKIEHSGASTGFESSTALLGVVKETDL